MTISIRCIAALLAVSLILPMQSIAAPEPAPVKSVKLFQPEAFHSAPVKIPVETSSKINWFGWTLIVLLVAGGAAAAAGGGGGGSTTPTTTTNGNVSMTW